MTRSKAILGAMMVAGAAAALSACAADTDYDSSQFAYGNPIYEAPPYGYPTYGYFDFDDWGGDWRRRDHWHGGHH